MNSIVPEHESYEKEIESLTSLYREGVSVNYLLTALNGCIQKYSLPEHRAHFLYMIGKVLFDMGNKGEAYRVFHKTEALFPETLYSRAAADTSKQMFVDEGGSLLPAPVFPPTVQVEPTNCCNIDCIMCERSNTRKRGHMSFDVFKRVVDQTLAAGAYAIRLYHMGEPLLNKSIVRFIAYFNDKVKQIGLKKPCAKRYIGIMTNGTLMGPDMAQYLMKAGLNGIGFSIDGRSSEEYEKIRKGAKYDQVISNLKSTSKIRDEHRYSTSIHVSVVDMGLERFVKEKLHQFYLSCGADDVSFNKCALHKGRQIINNSGEMMPVELAGVGNHAISDTNCSESRTFSKNLLDRILVLWNGDIAPSCGEPKPKSIIGNLKELTLAEANKIKMENLFLAMH